MAHNDKKQTLFLILTGIFITSAVLAELIGVKIFSLEAIMGMAPAQIKLMGDLVLDFNLTAGVLIWPVVFVTTDIVNEYFGRKGVQKITFLAVALIAYAFVVILFVTKLTPAQFWLELNSQGSDGESFNINYAFTIIYTQGMGIIIGSLIAFGLGQLLDVFLFHKFRLLTGSRMLWLRATGSTLGSQLLDSFVVLLIAFYVFGNWSFNQVIAVGIINYIYKFIVAVALTPLLYLAHFVIDRYLGKNEAEIMIEEAAASSRTMF